MCNLNFETNQKGKSGGFWRCTVTDKWFWFSLLKGYIRKVGPTYKPKTWADIRYPALKGITISTRPTGQKYEPRPY